VRFMSYFISRTLTLSFMEVCNWNLGGSYVKFIIVSMVLHMKIP